MLNSVQNFPPVSVSTRPLTFDKVEIMPEDLEVLEQQLKNRSRQFIKLANFSLYVIVGIIIIGISFYYFGGKFFISKSTSLKKEKIEILTHYTDQQLKQIIDEIHEQNLSKEGSYKILSKFRHDLVNISKSVSDIEKTQFLIIVIAITATIGLIFIQAFLIHTMEGVYVYYFTLGTYFKNRADSVTDTESTKSKKDGSLENLLPPKNFNFEASTKRPDPQTRNIAENIE